MTTVLHVKIAQHTTQPVQNLHPSLIVHAHKKKRGVNTAEIAVVKPFRHMAVSVSKKTTATTNGSAGRQYVCLVLENVYEYNGRDV